MEHDFHLHIDIVDWIFILLCCIILSSCKTTAPIVVPSLVIRDSISVTYRQGKEQPFSLNQIEEQPASQDAIGAAIESRKNSSVPTDGTVGVGATQGASVFEGLLSQRTNKKAVPPTTTIRVDTVVIEKWHTQKETEEVQVKYTPPFYKRCTAAFFGLLVGLLIFIAIRFVRLIYFRR